MVISALGGPDSGDTSAVGPGGSRLCGALAPGYRGGAPRKFVRLPDAAIHLLATFDLAQFVVRGARRARAGWRPATPGCLELFSGSRRVARRACCGGAFWVLCIDPDDSTGRRDLHTQALWDDLEELIRLGAFCGLGASVPGGSFSRAHRLGWRSDIRPYGTDDLGAEALRAVTRENFVSSQLAALASVAVDSAVPLWICSGDGSLLWAQDAWQALLRRPQVGDLRLDWCRCGTPWRKRTRVVTNCATIVGQRALCTKDHPHTILAGRRSDGRPWTKVASAYPWGVAHILAYAWLHGAGELTNRLDVSRICAAFSRRP